MGVRPAPHGDGEAGDGPPASDGGGENGRRDRPTDRRTPPDRPLRPDGGAAQSEERSADEDDSGEEASESNEDAAGDETERAGGDPDEESQAPDESESSGTDADEQPADETADEVADESGPDESTGEADTDESADEEADEDAEGVHRGGAEAVYEGEDASGVAHLDLDGLALDLLGLEVHLDDVVLDVSARPGEHRLLGNLLSSVTGLLDGLATSPLSAIKDALGGAFDRVREAIPTPGSPVGWLRTKLGGLWSRLLGVFGVGESESTAEEGEAEDGDEAGEEGGGIRAAIGGYVRRALGGLVSSLPLEDVLARVLRAVLKGVAESASRATEEPTDDEQADAQRAEAQS